MQIRYLEAMQAMAKTSNSKVIFLPAMNQTMAQDLGLNNAGEGSSGQGSAANAGGDGFQRAIDARMVENI